VSCINCSFSCNTTRHIGLGGIVIEPFFGQLFFFSFLYIPLASSDIRIAFRCLGLTLFMTVPYSCTVASIPASVPMSIFAELPLLTTTALTASLSLPVSTRGVGLSDAGRHGCCFQYLSFICCSKPSAIILLASLTPV
jgi:hypothetical protein